MCIRNSIYALAGCRIFGWAHRRCRHFRSSRRRLNRSRGGPSIPFSARCGIDGTQRQAKLHQDKGIIAVVAVNLSSTGVAAFTGFMETITKVQGG